MDRIDELKARFTQEPFAKLLGASLVSLGDGTAVLEMTAGEGLMIVGGIAQGGAVASLADYAGVYAAMTRIPSGHTPAVNITTQLHRPVVRGEKVFAAATVVNENRSSIFTIVEVRGEDNKLKATANIYFVKPRP
jgi:uncharacterized protein (TIGR00369 family)